LGRVHDTSVPLVRLKSTRPDHWDFATLLELAVLAEDRSEADKSLTRALAAVREPWEPETTANNLGFIREARNARGNDVGWLDEVMAALMDAKGTDVGRA